MDANREMLITTETVDKTPRYLFIYNMPITLVELNIIKD